MHEIVYFGGVVLAVGGTLTVALLSVKLTRLLHVPAPAVLLLGAALASDLFPRLQHELPGRWVERIAVLALIVILFDGGMNIGLRRFRAAATPIGVLGVVGTFATAALLAHAARFLLGFGWTTASLIGAALAPTDPAVMFSVLGNREVSGRSGTILEGESGANDPVGIALMVGLLGYATSAHGSPSRVVTEFVVQMGVGLAVGGATGWALVPYVRRVTLPREGLYPIRTLTASLVIYGAAALAHGSGFLAVFVAGLMLGDERAPFKGLIDRFHASLASLSEIAVFVALGLTVDLGRLGTRRLWLDGIVLAVLLALAIRPLVVVPMLLPARLRWGERLFVAWGGLKGAVPILLAALALNSGARDSADIYSLVFVVVAFSVVVQGTSMPFAARRLGVPMRVVEPEPWAISVRFGREPEAAQRYVLSPHARAADTAIADLPISERTWISMLVRDGAPLHARGGTVLRAGDEVLLLGDPEDAPKLRSLFEGD